MKIKTILILIVVPVALLSQRKSDLGLCIGTAYYMGDVNPTIPFYSPGINFGFIYRYNFNIRYALKLEGNYMKIGGSDADFTDVFQKSRDQNFSTPIYDFAAQFEFNFLPLKFVARKFGFSPFFSSGGAASYYAVSSDLQSRKIGFVFPFAIGMRSTYGKNWSIGVQLNFRKTFEDGLDGVQNLVDPNLKSVIHNNDWYSFTNVYFTYKIFNYKDNCPAYEKDL